MAGSEEGSYCFVFFKCIARCCVHRAAGSSVLTGAHEVLDSSPADGKDELVKIKRERQVVLLNTLSCFLSQQPYCLSWAVSVSPLSESV